MPAAAIDRFSGRYRFLSNFYLSPFEHDGIRYPTNEHFFNAHKTEDPQEHQFVASAPTPTEAKGRGRRVRLRPDWDTVVRYDVMRLGLELKFADPVLRRLLLETGDAELVEGTTWHDTHWGICVCSAHRGQGQNHLGRLLIRLRAGIQTETLI
jgi:ribA/ribD-fused uncharacterized protein